MTGGRNRLAENPFCFDLGLRAACVYRILVATLDRVNPPDPAL